MLKNIFKKQAHEKYFCCTCLKSGKGDGTCGKQDHHLVRVSHKIHFPSPKKSKTRWKEFIKKADLYKWHPFCCKSESRFELKKTLVKMK